MLIIEGNERPLRQWDFVHFPAETKHTSSAPETPCVALAVGARQHQGGSFTGGYTVDAAALRHGAGVDQETTEVTEAYTRLPKRAPTRYSEGSLRG